MSERYSHIKRQNTSMNERMKKVIASSQSMNLVLRLAKSYDGDEAYIMH